MGPVRKYVVQLAGESEADDILQEVALKIHRQIRHLRELENDPELIRSAAAANSVEQEEVDFDFLRLVDRAPPASRAVLLLHYQQHLSLGGCDRKALASAERSERLSRVKEIVATILAFAAVIWLTERSSKPELRLEPLLIGGGLIAAVCTAKVERLINENTKAVLQAISDQRRG